MRRAFLTACVVYAVLVSSGHVGLDAVVFEGEAGPYPVRVVIRPPTVIPGIAQIAVRVRGAGIEHVTVQPFQWNAGPRGAPPPDTARVVPGAAELYSAELWLMTRSAYSVHVDVQGAEGSGTAIVPLNAVASDTLPMERGYGLVLLGLGIFLFVGAVSILGAAAGQSVLEPGEEPGRRARRRSGIVMGAAAVVLAGLIFFGDLWWGAVEAEVRGLIYRPPRVEASVAAVPSVAAGAGNAGAGSAGAGSAPAGMDVGGGRVLTLEIVDERWRSGRWPPLVPDHGKLMHMFVLRDDFSAFAHLHPTPVDSVRFHTALPEALPAGTYRIYADVTHESGFAQTLVDTVTVPQPVFVSRSDSMHQPMAASQPVPVSGTIASPADGSSPATDPDDSWYLSSPGTIGSGEERTVRLADGSSMTWTGTDPVSAGEATTLRFQVAAPDGRPARLVPYMGMAGHAAVSRQDGSVFAHLHPSGTISWAARRTFELRSEADSNADPEPARDALDGSALAASGASMMPMRAEGEVAFPFVFPERGEYRIWVQVKRGGDVLTGAFDMILPADGIAP